MKRWKEHNLLRNREALREADSSKMTVYAGFDHEDYEDPTFSTKRSAVSNYEYTAKVTAPVGTYVIFQWNDEEGFFFKATSPEDAIANWTKELESQVNEEGDWYLEDDITRGLELDKEDYPTPEEAAEEAYNIVANSEPDGDSNYGIIWKKIEDFPNVSESINSEPGVSSKSSARISPKQYLQNCVNEGILTRNPDGTYDKKDYSANVDIRKLVINGRLICQFNKWNGDFSCRRISDNYHLLGYSSSREKKSLVTLKGCPRIVSGDFKCDENNLVSLEGGPEIVEGSYDCSTNLLTNLKGAPRRVGGDFSCFRNNLTSLEGSPKTVGEDFNCMLNNLTTLKGGPEKVGGSYIIGNNPLASFDGLAKSIGGTIYVSKDLEAPIPNNLERVSKTLFKLK